ncbi:SRPBCC domain-containing protein [Arthrobacter sp. H16F315]|uniref:SRPBCC domain-containing protein n=1 Tax=Arthrobacter sp. H16F315 TaxID=2955314 RepID=UPI002097D662|nr:SRPBCC domain-containing protein [Arthrobacter sp. H16F315]MDD1476933.1 SRPBCC domain-containing protein [Arthrobacter sp. H16F315]
MTNNTPGSLRTLATLLAADGKGIVRIEDRFDTDRRTFGQLSLIPAVLARWLGEVEGDLRQGGNFSARYFASGWEGTCHVKECRPQQRLLIQTKSPDEPDGVIEATLTADGDQAVLVIEDRGLPPEKIAAYAAGDQVHVEDLASYLAGRERCDARVRWQETPPRLPGTGRKAHLGPLLVCPGYRSAGSDRQDLCLADATRILMNS